MPLPTGWNLQEDVNSTKPLPKGWSIDPNSAEPSGMDKILDFLRPVADSVVGTAAGASIGPFGGGVGNVALGAGASVLTDSLLQKLYSDPKFAQSITSKSLGQKPGSIGDTLANAGQNTAINEIGGPIINKGLRGAKGLVSEIADPGSVVGDIYKLNPTWSQYVKGLNGNTAKRPFSAWIEDMFGAGSKANALENSSNAARSIAQDEAGKLTGKAGDFGAQLAQLDTEYANNRNIVNTVSKLNQRTIQSPVAGPQDLTVPGNNVSNVYNPSNPARLGSQIGYQRVVQGPVTLEQTTIKLNNFLQQAQKDYGADFAGAPDSVKQLIKIAKTTLDNTGAQFDPATGAITRISPLSFNDAESLRTALDKNSIMLPNEQSTSKTLQGQWHDSLTNDIGNSIKGWNDPGKTAYSAYQRSAGTLAQKAATLSGRGLRGLIDDAQGSIPQIDSILQQPEQLQRTLNSGILKGMPSKNMRSDLQGYTFMKMFSEADKTNGLVDGTSLFNKWNDPAFKESRDMLFSAAQRSDIGDFFKNVAMTSQKQSVPGNFQKIRMVGSGIAFGSSLLAGSLEGMGTFAGMEVGGAGLAKVLTTPSVARALKGLVTGVPLSMSQEKLGRLITGALQGTTVSMLGSNGQTTKGTIDNGAFKPSQP